MKLAIVDKSGWSINPVDFRCPMSRPGLWRGEGDGGSLGHIIGRGYWKTASQTPTLRGPSLLWASRRGPGRPRCSKATVSLASVHLEESVSGESLEVLSGTSVPAIQDASVDLISLLIGQLQELILGGFIKLQELSAGFVPLDILCTGCFLRFSGNCFGFD